METSYVRDPRDGGIYRVIGNTVAHLNDADLKFDQALLLLAGKPFALQTPSADDAEKIIGTRDKTGTH